VDDEIIQWLKHRERRKREHPWRGRSDRAQSLRAAGAMDIAVGACLLYRQSGVVYIVTAMKGGETEYWVAANPRDHDASIGRLTKTASHGIS
jgi:hypothetical protein